MIFAALFACNASEDPDPALAGADYFPLVVGHFLEYEVTETRYRPNAAPETRTFQLRQEIVDSIINQAGGVTYVIYRYTRDNEANPWVYKTTWSARREINRIVVQEGNIPFIRLSLPVRSGLMWDGNALNAEPEDTYLMNSVNSSETLPDGTTAPVLQVIQEEFDDIIVGERDIRRESYARNIGLIRREWIQLDLCPIDNCPNQEIIEGGIEYREILTAYGTVD